LDDYNSKWFSIVSVILGLLSIFGYAFFFFIAMSVGVNYGPGLDEDFVKLFEVCIGIPIIIGVITGVFGLKSKLKDLAILGLILNGMLGVGLILMLGGC
jgi:hypothetical protein